MPAIQRVQRGDIITAEFVNLVIDALNEHTTRITALEASGPSGDTQVVITSITPPSGSVRIGQDMTIFGRNFGHSAGLLRVFIDDTPVDNFNRPGTDDQTIIITVPASLGNPPSTGRPALLTVSNSSTSAQRSITILPSANLSGSTPISQVSTTPATPASNALFTISLRVESQLSRSATLTFTPSVAGITPAGVQVINSSGNPITALTIEPAAQVNFGVRMQIPPGVDGTPFTLGISAQAEGATRGSATLPFTVGTPAEQPDPSIVLSVSPNVAFNGAGGTFAGGVLSLRPSAGAQVTVPALISAVGTYVAQATLEEGATGWQTNVTESAAFTVTDADLNNPQGRTSRSVRVAVLRGTGAVTPGRLRIRVQRTAPPGSNGSSVTVSLALLS